MKRTHKLLLGSLPLLLVVLYYLQQNAYRFLPLPKDKVPRMGILLKRKDIFPRYIQQVAQIHPPGGYFAPLTIHLQTTTTWDALPVQTRFEMIKEWEQLWQECLFGLNPKLNKAWGAIIVMDHTGTIRGGTRPYQQGGVWLR